MTNRDRILAVVRISSAPLDDDQLSERAEVRPRQTVNLLCRQLEREGVLRRYVGVDGKIVNELVAGAASQDEVVAVERSVIDPRPPGSSSEQRNAEAVMLELLGGELGLTLRPARFALRSGERLEVDGVDSNQSVLVECWAHQGEAKPAQKHKVLADAFKLQLRQYR